jgi:DNA-binding beta-propeller fold protein YncE
MTDQTLPGVDSRSVLAGAGYGLDAPTAVTAAGGKVFVINGASGNTVTAFDARTGALAYTLSAAKYHLDSPAGIAVVGNRAWIVNSSGSVVELAL